MSTIAAPVTPKPTILPLENGDRLARAEFERRYSALPYVKKAELIEGIVYMPSPLRAESHAKPHAAIMTWLGVYAASTAGVGCFDNATVRLDPDNEFQPDALLRLEHGGQSRISEDDYIEGAPELVVEIAASSASIDLHEKLKVYRRNKVQEYIVWRVYDGEVDWFELQGAEYVRIETDPDGIIRSRRLSGLWLDREALLLGKMAEVLETVRRGVRGAKC